MATDPEKLKAAKRRYRLKNLEREKARSRASARKHYYEKKRGNVRTVQTPEERLRRGRERSAARRAEDPGHHKRWESAQPIEWVRQIRRASWHRRRARKLGAPIERVTAAQLDALFEAFRGLCGYCGIRPGSQVDHFVPLERGGAHAFHNLVASCGFCNQSKRDRDPFVFLHETAERPED